MTLDAGPMCPYCFKRGDHWPNCPLFVTAEARRSAFSIPLQPKDKS